MPKMKSNRGAAKRFKVTGRGKVMGFHSNANHFQAKKDTRRKRRLRQPEALNATNAKRIRRLLAQ